ncbi:MAG: lytic transglycosylase domain-containing protein [Lachnospiraceae bacterium]|nr:lytic transglycosylase domain-containing protein [Lachnospiraceae bacterium]
MKKTKYDTYFKEAAEKYGVSESLLKAIAKAESDFSPNEVSSAGAIGIMQLMPETAKSLGVTDPYDPRQNILGGAKCIAQKLKEFNGDIRLALAAYNAGSGAVKRNGGVPSYCTKYVNRVISYKEAYETAVAVG